MDDNRIRWAKKLPPQKLVKLYQSQACGIIDDDLLEDVGMYLYLRCESIIMVGKAELFCPKCRQRMSFVLNGEVGQEAACGECGWHCSIQAFRESYRHRELWQGKALECFDTYFHAYPLAKAAGRKIILIDTLIHSFHMDAKLNLPNRGVGNNLIEGSLADVMTLLDSLSGIQPDHDIVFKKTSQLMWKRRRNQLASQGMDEI